MHEFYMQRCLDLAGNGLGETAPNPMVGCVIVHEGKIIGEGYHKKYGEAHAEVNAINSVINPSLLKESTIYVSLEPCAHYGQTPPCADLIIEKKIPNVVVGCVDTFSKVSGKGIEKLQKAGVNVISGILERECREINKRFFTFHEKQRPYVILKWAQTADGFISPFSDAPSDRKIISNLLSRKLVHKWRGEEQTIMVGTRTALEDDPKLNVRLWKGKDPVRVVIDRDLKLPSHLNLFDQKIHTLVFNAQKSESSGIVEYIKCDFSKELLGEILSTLHKRNYLSVLVEGGEFLLNSFIKKNLWDEARVFVSDKMLNGGVKAPKLSGNLRHKEELLSDTLFVYHPNNNK